MKIGISACLVGHKVRHDGSDKRSRLVLELLGASELHPVCPEVAAGLGTPRPTIRLVAAGPSVVVREGKSGVDHTAAVEGATRELLERMPELDGFVVKSGSPSCGLERVRLYDERTGIPHKSGVGVFTRALRERFPTLPVEEEGRLNDEGQRESFILRVNARHRLRGTHSIRELQNLHAEHKYLLLAFDEARLRQMGPLLARATPANFDDVKAVYERLLLEALSRPAHRRRRQNALHLAAGHLRELLTPGDARSVHEVIEGYGAGDLSLEPALTVLRLFQARVQDPYLKGSLLLKEARLVSRVAQSAPDTL